MKSFKPNSNSLKLAGVLQSFGKPYSELFIDEWQNRIYISALVGSPKEDPLKYIITETTSDLIRDYMNGMTTLSNIFKIGPKWDFEISENVCKVKEEKEFYPDKNMKAFDNYDSDLCDSDVLLECFLNDFDNINSNRNSYETKDNKLQSWPVLIQSGVMEGESEYGKNDNGGKTST